MSWQDDLTNTLASIPLELERLSSELATGLQQSHNGTRLQGARYTPAGGGRALLYAGTGRLVGWSLRAVGGDVSVTLRDSRDDAGDILAVLELPAGASSTEWFGPGGVSFGEGLRAVVSGAGALEGAVWTGAVD